MNTQQLPIHRQHRPTRRGNPFAFIPQSRHLHQQLRPLARRNHTHRIERRWRNRPRSLHRYRLDTNRTRLLPRERPHLVSRKTRPVTLMPSPPKRHNRPKNQHRTTQLPPKQTRHQPPQKTSATQNCPSHHRRRSHTIQHDPQTIRTENNNQRLIMRPDPALTNSVFHAGILPIPTNNTIPTRVPVLARKQCDPTAKLTTTRLSSPVGQPPQRQPPLENTYPALIPRTTTPIITIRFVVIPPIRTHQGPSVQHSQPRGLHFRNRVVNHDRCALASQYGSIP